MRSQRAPGPECLSIRHVPRIALFLLAAADCSGDGLSLPSQREPAAVVILGGDAQADTVGRALRDSLVVRVTDGSARPIMHQQVRFVSLTSGAAEAAPSVETDAAGRAAARWVLGTAAGPQIVEAQVGGGLTADFHAVALAALPEVMVSTSGDSQAAVVGSELPDPLVATATDRYGNPVAGVQATWSVVGGGQVTPSTTISGADGQVVARRTLGAAPGGQQAIVSAPGLKGSPVIFVQFSSQGPPMGLSVQSGNGQTGLPGALLANPLIVRLTDAMGNGLPGRTVAWDIQSGGGTITAAATTDAEGRASAVWRLGPLAGPNSAQVTSSGFTTTLTAMAAVAVPVVIAATSPTTLGGVVTGPALPVPSVRVTDAAGKPVSGVLVTFAVTGGGSVAPATGLTDASGNTAVSLWTLGPVAGSNSLTASAANGGNALSGSPVLFTALAVAGIATRLVLVTQPADTVTTGLKFPRQPVLQLVDAQGNPVTRSGAVCTASLASGAPALGGTLTATSSAAGLVTFTSLAISGVPGARTLMFGANGTAPVTSNPVVVQNPTSTVALLVQPSATVANGAVLAVQPSVLVVDRNGMPMSGITVVASVTPAGTVLGGQLLQATNPLGIATFNGLSLTGAVGSYTLTLTAAGSSAMTTAISLTPGALSASMSTATVPRQGRIDHETKVTVVARDQSGNPLASGGLLVQITVTGANPAGPLTATDNGDGTYAVGYTPARKGADEVAVTLNGAAPAGSPYPSDVR